MLSHTYSYNVCVVFGLRKDEIYIYMYGNTEMVQILVYTCAGMWFMHCHIDAHLTIGLAMVFEVEDGPSTKLPAPPPDLPQC